MLLTGDAALDSGRVAQRIAGFGGRVEAEGEMFAALSAVLDDPAGYGLFIMECDDLGGLDAGRRAVTLLAQSARPIATILISRECGEQVFPEDRSAPILLRAPLSAVALRVAMEHAVRDLRFWLGRDS